MKTFAAVVVLAACGGSQRTVANGERIDVDAGWGTYKAARHAERPTAIAMRRPQVDFTHVLPDFHDLLRWPLPPMTHPTMAPQFAIAGVFAQPGIEWTTLCQRGAQNRITPGKRDELQYLRGWCMTLDGDSKSAVATLAPLTKSPVRGLAVAAREDLINIMATSVSADVAQKLLAEHGLHDFEIVDTLAATYLELDKNREAAVMNRHALEDDIRGSAATQCRRTARDMILHGESDREQRRRELKLFATVTNADTECVELFAAVRCKEAPDTECEDYFKASHIDTRYQSLLWAYLSWPDSGTYWLWMSVAKRAIRALPLTGAEPLVRVSVDAAIAVAPMDCPPDLATMLASIDGVIDEPRYGAVRARCAEETK